MLAYYQRRDRDFATYSCWCLSLALCARVGFGFGGGFLGGGRGLLGAGLSLYGSSLLWGGGLGGCLGLGGGLRLGCCRLLQITNVSV